MQPLPGYWNLVLTPIPPVYSWYSPTVVERVFYHRCPCHPYPVPPSWLRLRSLYLSSSSSQAHSFPRILYFPPLHPTTSSDNPSRFTSSPIQFYLSSCFTRVLLQTPRSLRDLMVRSSLPPTLPLILEPSFSPGPVTTPVNPPFNTNITSLNVTDWHTNHIRDLFFYINFVYCIQCTPCNFIYAGQTGRWLAKCHWNLHTYCHPASLKELRERWLRFEKAYADHSW